MTVQAFFGPRLAARADEIGGRFQSAQDYLESPALRQLPHPFPGTRRARVRADRRALDALIDGEIARCRDEPADDPEDLLAALVAEGDLTDAEIRDQVVTLIGAGYDTTAASLAWALCRTMRAPDVWRAVRAEADEALGSFPVELPVADRVVRETLRLHPAGVVGVREAATDIELGGHLVRAGTVIAWSPYLAGRDPDVWDDPLAFEPDRWLDLDPDRQASADQAWVPFGRGPRRCLGFAMAQMELSLMLARLVQRLDAEPSGDPGVPQPVGMVVNRPAGGVPASVRARAGWVG